MKQPLLSIVLPVYNTAKYLEQCIDSILSQTFKDFELLAIDDCSTDNSLQILRQYEQKDSRVQIFRAINRGGQAKARNSVIEQARGEYIGFVDSDDYLEASMYERMLAEAIENEAEIVVCGHYSTDENGNRKPCQAIRERRVLTGIEATKEVLRDEKIFSFPWDKIYRAELWEGVRFPVGVVYEDTATTFRVFEKANKVVQLPDCLYNYRQTPTSTLRDRSHEQKLKRAYDNFKAFFSRYDHVRNDARYADVKTVCADKAFLYGTDALVYDLCLNGSTHYYNICKQMRGIAISDVSAGLRKSLLTVKHAPLLYKLRLLTKWRGKQASLK